MLLRQECIVVKTDKANVFRVYMNEFCFHLSVYQEFLCLEILLKEKKKSDHFVCLEIDYLA